MKAAPCSCRVRISLIEELRRLSTTSRFSSPGTPKMRSTPSFSSAATSKSDPLGILSPNLFYRQLTLSHFATSPRIKGSTVQPTERSGAALGLKGGDKEVRTFKH